MSGFSDWITVALELTIVYETDDDDPTVDSCSPWPDEDGVVDATQAYTVGVVANDPSSGVASVALEDVGVGSVFSSAADCSPRCWADHSAEWS